MTKLPHIDIIVLNCGWVGGGQVVVAFKVVCGLLQDSIAVSVFVVILVRQIVNLRRAGLSSFYLRWVGAPGARRSVNHRAPSVVHTHVVHLATQVMEVLKTGQ